MINEQRVKEMRDRFEQSDPDGEDDEVQTFVTALNWVLGHHEDHVIEAYIPE